MPETARTESANGVGVETVTWHGQDSEVQLVAIRGGGHGILQAYCRRPRLLGPSLMPPDGPALIWEFFAQQENK